MLPVKQCSSYLRTAMQCRSYRTTAHLLSDTSPLPRVAHRAFWASLVPSFMRRATTSEQAARRAHGRDAATHERRTGLLFLFLGILVGSNAINIIAVRRDMLNFTRHTEAKLALLREVVHRVREGEDVAVPTVLGTNEIDPEKDWERLIQELENTDMLSDARKRRDAKRAQEAEGKRVEGGKGETRISAQELPDTVGATSQRENPKFLM